MSKTNDEIHNAVQNVHKKVDEVGDKVRKGATINVVAGIMVALILVIIVGQHFVGGS